jgi:hypothetical protein
MSRCNHETSSPAIGAQRMNIVPTHQPIDPACSCCWLSHGEQSTIPAVEELEKVETTE